METLTARSGREVYASALDHVIKNGRPRWARGLPTIDAGFTTILLEKPYDALPLGTGRKLNKAIAAVEALQLIGGFSAPSLILRISDAFGQFMNGDGFHGAYGSRIKLQACDVVDKLRKDEHSRQAVVTLWDPRLDNLPGMKDYPCTVALQFEVENGKLCMNTIMRSNDAWLGLPYDVFQFTQLQMSVARSLSLADGWYRHTALSLHLYEKDIQRADEAIKEGTRADGPYQPMGIGAEHDDFTEVMKMARYLTTGRPSDSLSLSEEWYRDVLAPYLG